MGPNPIIQARSDFYDDDSIMYTYKCVGISMYVGTFSSVCQILSFSPSFVVRSFDCFLANRCHQMEFFNLFQKNVGNLLREYINISMRIADKQSPCLINTLMLGTLAKILKKYLIFNYSNGEQSKQQFMQYIESPPSTPLKAISDGKFFDKNRLCHFLRIPNQHNYFILRKVFSRFPAKNLPLEKDQ